MRRLALLLAALALMTTSATAEQWRDVDVHALIDQAPGRDDYPDAAGIILNQQEMSEIREDGSVVTTRNRLIRILTLRGRETYSNQSFLYNTDSDVIALPKCVTVHRSGRVLEVGEDEINDVTPAFLADATVYANVLTKVISFPLAGPGSTIELQLREEKAPADDASFSGIEYMGAEDPLLSASFTLRYPKGDAEPNFDGTEGLLGPASMTETSADGEISFVIEEVPALVSEENMPSELELYPRFIYSSYSDWNEAAAFFAGEFYPHVQTGGDILKRVNEVTAGLSAEGDVVRAVFLDVATGVRNIHLSLGVGGYEPNDADRVLSNKYADTRDKSVLLISMLRAAGLSAYPALVEGRTDASFVETVPTLKQFSRILVAVPGEEGYTLLDPFLDNVSYGFLRWGRGNTALIVKDDGSAELLRIPGFDASDSKARNSMAITMGPDGSATINASCELTGYFDRKTRMELKDSTPSEVEKFFEGAANVASTSAASVEYSHSDLSNLAEPVSVTQIIEATDFAVPQGNMMVVHLPSFPHSFAETGVSPTLAERSYPFTFPCEFTSRLDMELSVPDGYRVAWIPEPASMSAGDVSFELSCETSEDGASLLWSRSVTVENRTISTDDYAEFKESYDTIASPKNRLIILEKA